MELDLNSAITVAVISVGLTQMSKNFVKGVPTWVYTIIMAVAAGIASAAMAYLPPATVDWLTGLSFSQLGYETIVQSVKKLLDKAKQIEG